MNSKDECTLRRILDYCNQINITLMEYSNSKELYMESNTCRNAICLCLLQIGELVSVLSEYFKASHPNLAWRDMKYLRNVVAHRYSTIDYEIIWKICFSDIPELSEFCHRVLC